MSDLTTTAKTHASKQRCLDRNYTAGLLDKLSDEIERLEAILREVWTLASVRDTYFRLNGYQEPLGGASETLRDALVAMERVVHFSVNPDSTRADR